MKLQTERIDKHRAQFTIEIEPQRLDDAKRKAARKISRQVNIRGFRKGKAPYRLVAQHVGEAAILEEALEALGDGLYKQALDESGVSPYGPGAFDDFKAEPTPTLVFSVPLEPEVDLKDYLDARVDYEEPQVSETQVDEALKQMRLRAVEVIDEEAQVAAAGHRVTIAVDSEFIDGEPADEHAEADADEDDGDDDQSEEDADSAEAYIPKLGDTFVKDDNAVIILDPNEDPFTHGFVEHLIGSSLGDDVVFELTIPDDDADETIIGRRVEFVVTMNKIEEVAIPALDDDFARQTSRRRGDEETDLAGLRQAERDALQRSAKDEANSQYSSQVLGEIVKGAEIAYPELALEEQIDEMVSSFERNLSQQGVALDDYFRLTNTSKDDLRDRHREGAEESLRQTLVLREMMRAQEIEVSEEDIDGRIDAIAAGYGASPELRKIFDTQEMRGNFRNELLMSKLNDLLVAIGRGHDPAQALEDWRERKAADAQEARQRSERLQRYRAEDAAEEEAEDEAAAADDGGARAEESDAPQPAPSETSPTS